MFWAVLWWSWRQLGTQWLDWCLVWVVVQCRFSGLSWYLQLLENLWDTFECLLGLVGHVSYYRSCLVNRGPHICCLVYKDVVSHTLRHTVLYDLTWCILPTWTGDTDALQCGLKQPHGPVLEAALFPCYFEHGVILFIWQFRLLWPLFIPFWWLFGLLWVWHGSVRLLETGPSCLLCSWQILYNYFLFVDDSLNNLTCFNIGKEPEQRWDLAH